MPSGNWFTYVPDNANRSEDWNIFPPWIKKNVPKLHALV